MIGELPKSLTVHGVRYDIRTDFRDVLKILLAFSDPELEDEEKIYVCLYILYPDFSFMREEDYAEAFKEAVKFIDHGDTEDDGRRHPNIMDWEQDEAIMFPAINKVAGYETRSCKYLHWWTFIGYYMEISDGVFANVLSMRLKKAKGKNLEKWEREYWNANKSLCVLKPKLTAEELAEKERLNAMLG